LNVTKPTGRFDAILHAPHDFGWIGVDLFFVLSGFLITGILCDAKGGAHYFRNFYARRSLRIFPLYYVFLALILFVFPRWFLAGSPLIQHLPAHPVWYWTYLSNFALVFRDVPNNVPLSATWSLAIEEQFYVVWPAVVLLCRRRTLQWICGGIAAAALACRIGMVLAGYRWLPLYYLTPCRMDSLAIGAFVALGMRAPGGAAGFARRYRLVPPVALAAAVIVMVQQRSFHWDGGLGQTLGYTVLGTLFASLVTTAVLAKPGGAVARALSAPVLRFFGRYSYAIYLAHLPVCLFVKAYLFTPEEFATLGGTLSPGQVAFYVICGSITVGLALISWNVLERPLLRLKRYFPASGVAGPSFAPARPPPQPTPALA